MKLFIYKTILLSIFITITYHVTLGYTVRNLKIDVINYFDKSKISFLKDKLREEIKKSLNKYNILNPDDAELLSDFIIKINNEIKNNK